MACTSRRNTDILSKTLDAEYRDSVMTFSFKGGPGPTNIKPLSKYQYIVSTFRQWQSNEIRLFLQTSTQL